MADLALNTTTTQDVPDGHIEDVPVGPDAPKSPGAVAEATEVAEVTEVAEATEVAEDVVVDEEPAQPAKRKRVSKYTAISKATFADHLELEGDVYIANISPSLNIISPTVTLVTSLVDDEGEWEQYATLKLKKTHAKLFKEFEESLLETAKSKKLEWFGSADIPDALIESSFKSFVDLDAKTLVVKIDDGIGGKTDIAEGTKIKAVLTVNYAIFTRTQFGAPFTLELVKSIEKSEHEYLFDPEEDESHAAITDAGILGYLGTERVAEQF